MPRKFFLISQVFYPDEVSTAGLFTDLCVELANRGNEVEVWCAQPSYNVRKRQKNRKINYYGVKICYLPSTSFRKDSMFGKVINMLSFTLSVSFKLICTRDNTAVFTHTTPPFLGIFISLLCLIKKRKFVFILLDIFPEGLVRLGRLKRNSFLTKFWQGCFVRSLKRSSKIIVIGRDMQHWVRSVYPECDLKVEYIPLWQNRDLAFPKNITDNFYLSTYNLWNKFIVQYSGNMGLWNDLISIGKAVNLCPDDVIFMFVGGGLGKKDLLNTILTDKKDRVVLLPFQPSDKLGALLSSGHIALVSLSQGLEGMAVPCKIYGILASGVPVIALVPRNSEIAMIIEEEKCGYVIDPNDSGGLINLVNKLKDDEETRREMGKNGQNAFLNKYTTEIICSRYEDFNDKL